MSQCLHSHSPREALRRGPCFLAGPPRSLLENRTGPVSGISAAASLLGSGQRRLCAPGTRPAIEAGQRTLAEGTRARNSDEVSHREESCARVCGLWSPKELCTAARRLRAGPLSLGEKAAPLLPGSVTGHTEGGSAGVVVERQCQPGLHAGAEELSGERDLQLTFQPRAHAPGPQVAK